MYVMVWTRPDIAHAVGVVSRFLTNHGKEHWEIVKWTLRYLRGTSRVCLCFGSGEPMLDDTKIQTWQVMLIPGSPF